MRPMLTWAAAWLWIGRIPLAQVRHTRKWGWQWASALGNWRAGGRNEQETRAIAKAEVRRLLKAAGVEVA